MGGSPVKVVSIRRTLEPDLNFETTLINLLNQGCCIVKVFIIAKKLAFYVPFQTDLNIYGQAQFLWEGRIDND